jgi:hypothetical protein
MAWRDLFGKQQDQGAEEAKKPSGAQSAPATRAHVPSDEESVVRTTWEAAKAHLYIVVIGLGFLLLAETTDASKYPSFSIWRGM